MIKQTGPRQESPVDGKEQNCDAFGEYEDERDAKSNTTAVLCHGGWFGIDWYEPCPVRAECYMEHQTTLRNEQRALNPDKPRLTVVQNVPAPRPEPTPEPGFRYVLQPFKRPNYDKMPTTQSPAPKTPVAPAARTATVTYLRPPGTPLTTPPPPSSRTPPSTPPTPTTVGQKVNELFETAVREAKASLPPIERAPAAVMPEDGAGPGRRTPFYQEVLDSVLPPTFLPVEGQSTFDRLCKNVLQAMIAAVGHAIWSFARRIDLFG